MADPIMATHFICQPTEPLPHKYPLVQKPEKTHGAVSSYETLNLEDKAHTRYPPQGWDNSQSSEESLPLCQAPAPWNVRRDLIGPDPALCITPEKSLANQKQRLNKLMYHIPKQHEPAIVIDPDPELCLTPEHYSDGVQRSNLKNDGKNIEETSKIKPKSQHRVRFELENSLSDSDKENLNDSLGKTSGSGKPYRPLAYGDDGDFVSEYSEVSGKSTGETSRKTKQHTITESNNKETIYVNEESENFLSKDKLNQNKSTKIYRSVLPTVLHDEQTDNGKEIVVKSMKSKKKKEKITSDPKPKQITTLPEVQKNIATVPKRKVTVTRESQKDLLTNDYKFPFSEGSDTMLEYEHVFTRPEYNSTLRMRTELEQIRESQVDVDRAVQHKLQSSDKKLIEIREKAASRVNREEEEFAGLVSLEIPVNSICSQAEKEKMGRVKMNKVAKAQANKDKQEPDLMEFFVPELQKELAEFSIPGLSTPSECLSTASHRSAFDLYRHNRVWEGTSNFRGGK